MGQGCSKTSLFTSFWEASAPKHDYLRSICLLILVWLRVLSKPGASQKHRYTAFWGPALLQNIAICRLLGGQCSQTPLFTAHLPSHAVLAVSVVEIRVQPKVSLVALFWARAAPKHRYLHAFGRPVLPNTNYLQHICPLILFWL